MQAESTRSLVRCPDSLIQTQFDFSQVTEETWVLPLKSEIAGVTLDKAIAGGIVAVFDHHSEGLPLSSFDSRACGSKMGTRNQWCAAGCSPSLEPGVQDRRGQGRCLRLTLGAALLRVFICDAATGL